MLLLLLLLLLHCRRRVLLLLLRLLLLLGAGLLHHKLGIHLWVLLLQRLHLRLHPLLLLGRSQHHVLVGRQLLLLRLLCLPALLLLL